MQNAKNVKVYVESTRRALSTGFCASHSFINRYDNVFVKGGATEVGCKDLQEPYLKCVLVCIIYRFVMVGVPQKAASRW